MCNLGDAVSSEDGLPKPQFNYYRSLLVGGTGLTGRVPDSRISGVNSTPPYSTLAPVPFQLTNSSSFPYISYAVFCLKKKKNNQQPSTILHLTHTYLTHITSSYTLP